MKKRLPSTWTINRAMQEIETLGKKCKEVHLKGGRGGIYIVTGECNKE